MVTILKVTAIIGYLNGVEIRSGTAHDPATGQFTSSGGGGGHTHVDIKPTKAKAAKEKSPTATRKEAVALTKEAHEAGPRGHEALHGDWRKNKWSNIGHYNGTTGKPHISEHPAYPEFREKMDKAIVAWREHFKHAPPGEAKAKDLAKVADTLAVDNAHRIEFHQKAAAEFKAAGNTAKAAHHEEQAKWHAESAQYDELRKHYKDWEKHLKPNQIDAIKNYAYGMDSNINGSLRDPRYGDRGVGHMIKQLDSALNAQPTPHAFKVYRTVGPEMAARFKVGDEFHDPGYGSSSTGEHRYTPANQHSWVKMHIDVPKGAYGAPISHLHPDELEFLLPRGSRFKVKAITEEDRGPHPKRPGVRMKTTHIHVDLL